MARPAPLLAARAINIVCRRSDFGRVLQAPILMVRSTSPVHSLVTDRGMICSESAFRADQVRGRPFGIMRQAGAVK